MPIRSRAQTVMPPPGRQQPAAVNPPEQYGQLSLINNGAAAGGGGMNPSPSQDGKLSFRLASSFFYCILTHNMNNNNFCQIQKFQCLL